MVLPINVPRYSKGKMNSWYSLEVGSVMCPLFSMLPINRISVMRFTNSYNFGPEYIILTSSLTISIKQILPFEAAEARFPVTVKVDINIVS